MVRFRPRLFKVGSSTSWQKLTRILFFWLCPVAHGILSSLIRVWTWAPLHWKCEISTTGPSGKSLTSVIFNSFQLLTIHYTEPDFFKHPSSSCSPEKKGTAFPWNEQLKKALQPLGGFFFFFLMQKSAVCRPVVACLVSILFTTWLLRTCGHVSVCQSPTNPVLGFEYSSLIWWAQIAEEF